MKYYKIIGNNHRTSKGTPYPYQLGLNTLKHINEQFDSQSKCTSGGLYFTTIESILDFVDYGDILCEVEVPTDSPVVQIGNKYKSDKIIIQKMSPLWTVYTFQALLASDIDYSGIVYAFKHACTHNYLPIVRLLVDYGVDIHVSREYALRYACKNGHLAVVELLVEQGADIHVLDDQALRLASEYKHLHILEFLINHGADVHAIDDDALRWSARLGYLPIVQCLVDHGADIHASNDYALQWACNSGHLLVVQYLIQRGANIHADDDHALIQACEGGHLSVVRYLVEKGANVHSNEDQVLARAIRCGHRSIVQYLIEHCRLKLQWNETTQLIIRCATSEMIELLIAHGIVTRLPPSSRPSSCNIQ